MRYEGSGIRWAFGFCSAKVQGICVEERRIKVKKETGVCPFPFLLIIRYNIYNIVRGLICEKF